jgi:hypothetical protein
MQFARRLLPVVLVVGSACATVPTARQYLDYDMILKEVERPAQAKERYGEQTLTTTADTVTRLVFEDRLVKALWVPTNRRLYFDLSNKTDHSIKIIWEDAAFVAPDGKSSAVMHTGVKYNECTGNKTPSVIVKTASIADVIIPCDYIEFAYSQWVVNPFLPTETQRPDLAAQAESMTAKHKGKRFSVLLPIQIEDVVNDYLFTFEVTGLSVRTTYR